MSDGGADGGTEGEQLRSEVNQSDGLFAIQIEQLEDTQAIQRSLRMSNSLYVLGWFVEVIEGDVSGGRFEVG